MNDLTLLKVENSILSHQYSKDSISATPEPLQFQQYLSRNELYVRESFLAETSGDNTAVIVFDLSWRILYCNPVANADLVKKDLIPIGTTIDKFAPLVKPQSSKNENTSYWKEFVRKGLLIGIRFKSTLLLYDGKKLLISLLGSPLLNLSGIGVGAAILYRKVFNN